MSIFLTSNRPVLTVMIQARTAARAIELIQKAKKHQPDAYGLQLEQLFQAYRTPQSLRQIFDAMDGKPIYVTNYTSNLNVNENEEALAETLLLALDCGGTLIDVPGDYFHADQYQLTYSKPAVLRQKKLIADIHKGGGEVLMSSHTEQFLPTEDVIGIALEHQARGADIAKVVIKVDSESQLQTDFQTQLAMRDRLLIKYLYLSQGALCRPGRVTGPLMGSQLFLCVAEHDEFSTPAQPLIQNAKVILETAGLFQ